MDNHINSRTKEKKNKGAYKSKKTQTMNHQDDIKKETDNKYGRMFLSL